MSYAKKSWGNKWKAPEIVRDPFIPKFPPSAEQQAIFDFQRYDTDNLHCNAGAGSGKSSTMLWDMYINSERAKQTGQRMRKTALMAFGSDIAKAMTPKVPEQVVVKTCHAFGRAAIIKKIPHFEPKTKGDSKNQILISDIDWLNPDKYKGQDKVDARNLANQVDRLMSLIKLTLTDWNNRDQLEQLVARYNLDFTKTNDKQQVTDHTLDVFAELDVLMDRSLTHTQLFDFDDMMWLPIMMDLPIEKFDQLYFDEAQDANNLMIEYANRMRGDRIMTVGDRYQSIYGFAGANPESTDKLIRMFNSTELPLMTCYRCGKDIIKFVNAIMPDLKAFEGNPDGLVAHHFPDDPPENKFDLNSLPDGSMILCRRNAGLVRPCFDLIKKGRKALIKGKDIGAGLLSLVDQLGGDSKTIVQFIDAIEVYRGEKLDAIMRRDKPNPGAIDYTNDQCDALQAFAENAQTVYEVKGRIDSMFSKDSSPGITLCSGHKSKGLEADNVVIVQAERMRIVREDMTDEQMQQERNLEYVMKTRAKKELHLVYES